MSKIYNPSEPVPVAAVVYAGNKSAYQHILFVTRYDVKGYYSILKNEDRKTDLTADQMREVKNLERDDTDLKWAIKSLNVSLVRDWSISTAMITLSCRLGNPLDPIPHLPDLSQIRGGNYPYLTVEDEIRIYMGYVKSPSTPITADMLDDFPTEPFDSDGRLIEKSDKPLSPVFWGFIDKVDIEGTAKGGIQCVISCRDRARIFQDTKIVSIPNLTGNTGSDRANTAETGVAEGRRDKILLQVAKAATGDVPTSETDSDGCWKKVLGAEEDSLAQLYTTYSDNNINRRSFSEEEATEDPSQWMRFATHKAMDYLSRPRFHIWVQRPPLVKSQGGGSVFQVINRSPIEIIQFLAATEERPIDFFASHINGDFIFGPRVLDSSGFNDKLRSYRTYFFRDWPRDKPKPNANQTIISMKSTTSTLATYNRFVVVDSNTNGPTAATLGENVRVSMEVLPWILSGSDRKVKPPCRTMIVFDGALSTYQNATGGALVVGLAASRIWARDITAVQMTVLGDPTFYPSEAVRVYNTILHDTNTLVDPGTKTTSNKREKAVEDFNSTNVAGEPSVTAQGIAPVEEQSNQVESVLRESTVVTDRDNLVLPVYKVRSVSHKIVTQGKNAGYTTEIGMISDY